MKKKLLSVLGIISLVALIADSPCNGDTGRAVSLKVLENRLEGCMAKGNCPEEVLQLCGITKILGYVVDEENNDIILVGKADNTLPPLYLEDFVIALRNAWLKYASLQGNTYLYSYPGCSIDPMPEVLGELQQIGAQILNDSDPENVQNGLNEWNNICEQPQKVRVEGIPFNTRFGKVMVDADYYMKRLVDSSVSLNIDGFKSLTDITLDVIKGDVTNNRPVSIPSQAMNRFWFYPGRHTYTEDDDIVLIKEAQVILLTEEEHLTREGGITGSNRPNPLARKFTDSFTENYAQIARERPIYSELEGLFIFVALAKVMKYKDVLSEAHITLDYLLNQFPVKEDAGVKQTLPGIANVKEFQHRNEYPSGYSTLYISLPSCGGVSIEINVKDSDLVRDTTGNLLKLKRCVLDARDLEYKARYIDVVERDMDVVKKKDIGIVAVNEPDPARDTGGNILQTKERVADARDLKDKAKDIVRDIDVRAINEPDPAGDTTGNLIKQKIGALDPSDFEHKLERRGGMDNSEGIDRIIGQAVEKIIIYGCVNLGLLFIAGWIGVGLYWWLSSHLAFFSFEEGRERGTGEGLRIFLPALLTAGLSGIVPLIFRHQLEQYQISAALEKVASLWRLITASGFELWLSIFICLIWGVSLYFAFGFVIRGVWKLKYSGKIQG